MPQAASVPAAVPAPPPWPQVVPAGLPPFPGSGWVPDQPPPAPVVQRANQLLSQLWSAGAGTFKTEQTAGRWITYKASPMGTKKGVVAYRLAAAPTSAPPPVTTMKVPAPGGTATVPVSVPLETVLPTLRRGSSGPDVVILQQRLGISADGKFGPGTEASVKTFQRGHGLTADGIVGPKTWSALVT